MIKPKLEQACPMLSLPQRRCFIKNNGQGSCQEESRHRCHLWQEYGREMARHQEETKLEEDPYWRPNERDRRIQMRTGARNDPRNIMRFRGSYGGYEFEGEFGL